MYNFKQLQMASGKFLVKDFIHFGNERFYNLEVWMLALDPDLTRFSLHLLLNFLLVSTEPKNQTHGSKSSLLIARQKELINNPFGLSLGYDEILNSTSGRL